MPKTMPKSTQEEKYRWIKPILEKEIKTTKFPMVALTDEQAILVKDSRIRLVGEKTKTFYNGFREN